MTVEFVFRALDTEGDLRKGTLSAPDRTAAADRLRRQGLRPVSVDRRRFAFMHREHHLPGRSGKRARHMALFSRQFAVMTRAGTPILLSLEALARQTEDRSLSEAIDDVRASVESGERLATALGSRPDWFDEFVVSLVDAGEQSGALADVLERLADTTERAAELRRRVRSAMAYPVAIGGLMVLTVVAMLVFLVPTFTQMYADLDGELPLPTRIITGLSGFLLSYAIPILLVLVAAWFAFRWWRNTPGGRLRLDRLKMRLPIFGPLISRTALAKFSRTLSVLVHAGLPITGALEVAGNTAGNAAVAQAVHEVRDKVAGGNRISDSMEGIEVFSPMVVQMISVGEESAALEQMLARITELYDDEVRSTVEGLTATMEPVLIMAMGVVVGGVLLAVYLPMFRAIDLIR